MTHQPRPADDGRPGKHVVLILSSDPVAAALLGGLVETLGYLVRFYRPPEPPDIAIRRERPSIAMIDCADPTLMKEDVLGRARMRDISVVIFGTPATLQIVRALVAEHDLDTLIMPSSLDALDETLRNAVTDC
jgi:DNA-binding NtrC family response regulator